MRGIEVGQIWFEKNLRTLDGSPPLHQRLRDKAGSGLKKRLL